MTFFVRSERKKGKISIVVCIMAADGVTMEYGVLKHFGKHRASTVRRLLIECAPHFYASLIYSWENHTVEFSRTHTVVGLVVLKPVWAQLKRGKMNTKGIVWSKGLETRLKQFLCEMKKEKEEIRFGTRCQPRKWGHLSYSKREVYGRRLSLCQEDKEGDFEGLILHFWSPLVLLFFGKTAAFWSGKDI